MQIIDFETVLLPILKVLKEKNEQSLLNIADEIAKDFGIPRDVKLCEIVGIAAKVLEKAGLIEFRLPDPNSISFHYLFKLKQRGFKVLNEKPEEITANYLTRFPEVKKIMSEHPISHIDPFGWMSGFWEGYVALLKSIKILKNEDQKIDSS